MRVDQGSSAGGPNVRFGPRLKDRPEWVSGGSFGPEASIFAVLVDAVAVWLMWRWSGSASAREAMLAPLG